MWRTGQRKLEIEFALPYVAIFLRSSFATGEQSIHLRIYNRHSYVFLSCSKLESCAIITVKLPRYSKKTIPDIQSFYAFQKKEKKDYYSKSLCTKSTKSRFRRCIKSSFLYNYPPIVTIFRKNSF